MASFGEVTVPLNYQITETSKGILKALIAETISEALADSNTIFPSEDALREFVRAEVRKALKHETMRAGMRKTERA